MKLLPPNDNRAIITFPIDSEGRYKYQVSVNVQISLGSRGIKKDIGDIKMLGMGAIEFEALQNAQNNESTDIAERVMESLRALHLL